MGLSVLRADEIAVVVYLKRLGFGQRAALVEILSRLY